MRDRRVNIVPNQPVAPRDERTAVAPEEPHDARHLWQKQMVTIDQVNSIMYRGIECILQKRHCVGQRIAARNDLQSGQSTGPDGNRLADHVDRKDLETRYKTSRMSNNRADQCGADRAPGFHDPFLARRGRQLF